MRRPELNIRRARGFLLIVAILVLVVIAVAIAALGNMTSADIRASSSHAQSEQAYFAATSGIEYAGFQFGPGTACNSGNIDNVTATVGQAQFTTTTQTYLASGATTTDAPLSAGNATINVSINPITNGYAPHGRIWIDAEQINYTGRTATSFTGATRGAGGTTATTHVNGSRVSQNQCLVRSTGVSGSATRIVEAAIARATNGERAMMVYAKGTAISGVGFDRNIYYRLWDPVNNAWLVEQTSTQQVANNATPLYFVLKFARTRNEAILGILDGLGNLYIHIWNGATNTWSTPAGGGPLRAGLATGFRGFQIEYEHTNDRAIIVYSNAAAANPQFAIWDGTILDTAPAAGGFIHSSLGLGAYVTAGVIRWFRLAANRAGGSNEILMITKDSNNDVWGARWTGGAWVKMEAGAAATWDATASANNGEVIDVAYQSLSNVALFAWGDNSATRQIGRRTWTPSTATLSGITNTQFALYGGAFVSAVFQWLRLYPQPDTSDMMAVLQDASVQLITARWDSATSTWLNVTAHDIETENNVDRNFDFAWQTVPFSLGRGWLVWGSDNLGTGAVGALQTRELTSPTTWAIAPTTIVDNTLLVNIGVTPMAGTMLAGLYQATASANDDTQGIYALGSAAAWTVPGGLQIWNGGTNSIQQGERVYVGVSPTATIILEQEEIYP